MMQTRKNCFYSWVVSVVGDCTVSPCSIPHSSQELWELFRLAFLCDSLPDNGFVLANLSVHHCVGGKLSYISINKMFVLRSSMLCNLGLSNGHFTTKPCRIVAAQVCALTRGEVWTVILALTPPLLVLRYISIFFFSVYFFWMITDWATSSAAARTKLEEWSAARQTWFWFFWKHPWKELDKRKKANTLMSTLTALVIWCRFNWSSHGVKFFWLLRLHCTRMPIKCHMASWVLCAVQRARAAVYFMKRSCTTEFVVSQKKKEEEKKQKKMCWYYAHNPPTIKINYIVMYKTSPWHILSTFLLHTIIPPWC